MYSWSQIVAGVFCILVTLFQIVNGTASRFSIAVFIVGGMLIYGGFQALNEGVAHSPRREKSLGTHSPESEPEPETFDDVRNPHAYSIGRRVESMPLPEDIQVKRDSPPIAVQTMCEACSKAYVYFPERTEIAWNSYQRSKYSVAPCPRCGWIQASMFDHAGEFWSEPRWATQLMRSCLGLLIVNALILLNNGNIFWGSQRDHTPNEPFCWYSNLVIFALFFFCMIAFFWDQNRSFSPNYHSVERRLAKGKLLGMPLEEYEAMLKEQAAESLQRGGKLHG